MEALPLKPNANCIKPDSPPSTPFLSTVTEPLKFLRTQMEKYLFNLPAHFTDGEIESQKIMHTRRTYGLEFYYESGYFQGSASG